MLESVILNPKKTPVASVIWLHGLGADGHDFESIVPHLQLPDNLPVRFIFPHAPLRPVSMNNGYVMRAWFDLYGLEAKMRVDSEGIAASEQAIHELIHHELSQGISADKIVLVGFSQGGAMALFCGLRYPQPLAGIMGLSTFLPLEAQKNKSLIAQHIQMPIFLAHGIYDTVLPFSLGESTRDYLVKMGYHVTWHSYPMQHEVCADEIRDMSRWLQKVLG